MAADVVDAVVQGMPYVPVNVHGAAAEPGHGPVRALVRLDNVRDEVRVYEAWEAEAQAYRSRWVMPQALLEA